MSAEQYATDVVDGKVISGPHMLAQCRRHLEDLEHGHKRGLFFNQEQADAATSFIGSMPITTGSMVGEPMGLFPWGAFMIESVYGWQKENGRRRFRKVYCESSKGSGKTPYAAAMAVLAICADNEARAEGYIAARNAEQASVAFRMAAAMAKERPELGIRIIGGMNPHQMHHQASGSFLKKMTSDLKARGKSGILPSFILLDEYHEQENAEMAEFLASGVKRREEPIMIITSNAGTGFDTPCGLEHEYAATVASGENINDAYLPMIFCMHDKDKPWDDEECWARSNPSLPDLPGYDYIRDRVTEARGLPGKATTVERLNFSRWESGGANAWVSRETWEQVLVEDLSSQNDRKPVPCYLGVDLSMNKDLTAVSTVWDFGGHYETDTTVFTPKDTMTARQDETSTPYSAWVEQGCLVAIPGTVIDYDVVAQHIVDICNRNDVKGIAYDQYKIDMLKTSFDSMGFPYTTDMKNEGVQLVKHPQAFNGFSRTAEGIGPCMPRSIDALDNAISEKKIAVKINPAVQSAVMGAKVVYDSSGTLRAFSKPKSGTKIDALVSLAMAVGLADFRRAFPLGPVNLSRIFPGFVSGK